MFNENIKKYLGKYLQSPSTLMVKYKSKYKYCTQQNGKNKYKSKYSTCYS